ncbi:MAG: hypothetical protein ACR2LK_05535 [Solirubrobacteraceae bacterium]
MPKHWIHGALPRNHLESAYPEIQLLATLSALDGYVAYLLARVPGLEGADLFDDANARVAWHVATNGDDLTKFQPFGEIVLARKRRESLLAGIGRLADGEARKAHEAAQSLIKHLAYKARRFFVPGDVTCDASDFAAGGEPPT